VAGTFSREWERTQAIGRTLYLNADRLYRSADEMAAREAALPSSARIDFVVIATPNSAHFPAAKAFLESGFHVVCDKPLAVTLAEAEEITRLVERSGLVFAVTHNYTGYPLIRHARDLFRSGAMGAVRKAIVEYLQDWLIEPLEKQGSRQAAWRTNPAEAGIGGAIADIGTHALHLLEYVTGDRVTELCADMSTFLPDRQLDEDVNALLRLAGGGKGVLAVSQIATGEENGLRLRVYGATGAVLWSQENPNYLHVYRHGRPRETLTHGRSPYLSDSALAATRLPNGHPEGYLEAFANVYAGAIEAIRRHVDGHPMAPSQYDFPTVFDGVRVVRFIEAAVESARRGGAWLPLV
jgi:predicted dehydrogenase